MLQPIESPPASLAPLFAASIMPGPPPVMMANPALASLAASWMPAAYIGSPGRTRAEPKNVTAAPTLASVSKPATNSPWMRSTRHVSVCVKSASVVAGLCSRRSSSVRLPSTPARLSERFPRRLGAVFVVFVVFVVFWRVLPFAAGRFVAVAFARGPFVCRELVPVICCSAFTSVPAAILWSEGASPLARRAGRAPLRMNVYLCASVWGFTMVMTRLRLT